MRKCFTCPLSGSTAETAAAASLSTRNATVLPARCPTTSHTRRRRPYLPRALRRHRGRRRGAVRLVEPVVGCLRAATGHRARSLQRTAPFVRGCGRHRRDTTSGSDPRALGRRGHVRDHTTTDAPARRETDTQRDPRPSTQATMPPSTDTAALSPWRSSGPPSRAPARARQQLGGRIVDSPTTASALRRHERHR